MFGRNDTVHLNVNSASKVSGAFFDNGNTERRQERAKASKNAKMEALFESVAENGTHLTPTQFVGVLDRHGILPTDPRISQTMGNMANFGAHDMLSYDDFASIARDNTVFIERVLQGSFVIGKFKEFTSDIRTIFNETAKNKGGQVATYIPQLGRVDPEKWGLAITTVDGQQMVLGDADEGFCVQSTSKVIHASFEIKL